MATRDTRDLGRENNKRRAGASSSEEIMSTSAPGSQSTHAAQSSISGSQSSFDQNQTQGQSAGSLGSDASAATATTASIQNIRSFMSRENMQHFRQQVLHQMQEKPLVTLALSFGAGYVVGAVIPRWLGRYVFSLAGASALDWVTGSGMSAQSLQSSVSNVLAMKGDQNEQFSRPH